MSDLKWPVWFFIAGFLVLFFSIFFFTEIGIMIGIGFMIIALIGNILGYGETD